MVLMTSADAQTGLIRRHHRLVAVRYSNERPPLTVNKRSFLDPGPVVPVGSMSNYVTMNTVFHQTPDQNFLRSAFGNEVLPGPLSVPGHPSPVLEFATPAYPD
jgi:hypothetical protein